VRGLELTDEGRGYLPTVQAAFATLEEGTAVLVGRNDPDVLELHANLSFAIFWLTPRLHRFMDEHPWVHLNVATSIWPPRSPATSAAVEIVFGQGKWESRAGQRLTHDTVFPVCTPTLARSIRDVFPTCCASACSTCRAPCRAGTPGWPAISATASSNGHAPVHRPAPGPLSLEWALQGLGVALAHDTVARDLIASGRLVRPVPYAIPMKEAYYLIAPEGSLINAAAKAFKVWLLREMLE
jgi:LysR family glycine cleavage system transcriptional activator